MVSIEPTHHLLQRGVHPRPFEVDRGRVTEVDTTRGEHLNPWHHPGNHRTAQLDDESKRAPLLRPCYSRDALPIHLSRDQSAPGDCERTLRRADGGRSDAPGV